MEPFLKPLSAQEEKSCLDAYQRGDTKARDILVERNLRLVAHVVKKYQGLPDDLDDLISIGTIGLIKAVMTYDSKKGNRLAAYAARCIDNELLMYLRSKKKTAREISLYEPIGTDKEGNEIHLLDIVEGGGEDIAEQYNRKEDAVRLYCYLDSELKEQEKQVLLLRYGLGGKENTHRNRSLPGSASAVRTCRGSRRMQLKSCGYGLPLRKCLTFQTDCFYNKG